MKGIIAFALLLSGLVFITSQTTQAQNPISIELVLAVDASASVNDSEFALRMNGIAHAFRSPDVIELIASHDGVAVTLIQWAGWVDNEQTIPWRLLDSRASVLSFASEVEVTQRETVGILTAIGTAIDEALKLIVTNNYAGRQLKIDISGDGQNNTGLALTRSKMQAQFLRVTINGLAVLTDVPNLDDYYEQHVIGGPGAFVIKTSDYNSFAHAMRFKLLRELAPMVSLREKLLGTKHAKLLKR